MTKSTVRTAALKQMLIDRRREMQDEAHGRMQAEAVLRVNEALRRLDAGTYGSCVECQKAIAERRLSALPFAIRCQRCEQEREEAQEQAQHLAGRRGSLSLFPDVMGP